MRMEPVVTEELIARQPPEAQAIIRALLAKMGEMEAELRELAEGHASHIERLPGFSVFTVAD